MNIPNRASRHHFIRASRCSLLSPGRPCALWAVSCCASRNDGDVNTTPTVTTAERSDRFTELCMASFSFREKLYHKRMLLPNEFTHRNTGDDVSCCLESSFVERIRNVTRSPGSRVMSCSPTVASES